MASLNDFGKKLSGFVQSASKKSEEIIDNAKLSSEINRLENNIDTLQFELGKAYYAKYSQDETCEFADFIVKINALAADVQKRNEVLLARKNLRSCPNCQTTVALNNVFCGKCGMRLPPIQYPAQDIAEEQTEQDVEVQYTQYAQDEQQTLNSQDGQQGQYPLDTQGTQQGQYTPYTQSAGEEPQAQSVGAFCSQCGAKNEASSLFCAACGQRFTAPGGEPLND